MDSTRRTAFAVGILFIAATGFFSVGQAAHGPILNDPSYLDLASPTAGRIVAGTLVEFIGVLAIPLTAVFLFPLLKHHSEQLALTYVAIRTLEAIPLLMVQANILAIVDISAASLGPDGPVAWQTAGATIQALSDATFSISVGLVFPIGCLLLNSMLLRTGLVPRWISAWGLLAAVLLLTGSVLVFLGALSGVPPATLEAVLAGPVAVQEMVFAIWLIAKGFDPEATRRLLPATS